MPDPFAPLRVLVTCPSALDPAIDMADDVGPDGATLEGTGIARLDAYRESRDPAALRFVAGATPAWFVCKRLGAATVGRTLQSMDPGFRNECAFSFGCHEVQTGDVEPMRPKDKPVKTGTDYLAKDEWYARCADRFGLDAVQEIGSVIYQHARLREGARGPFRYWGG